MQVTFQLTPEGCRQHLLVWRNLRPWRRWGIRAGCVFFGLGFVVVVLQLFIQSATTVSVIPGLILSAGFLTLIWAGPSLSARRPYRNTPSAHDPNDNRGIRCWVTCPLHSRRLQVAWSTYVAWDENKYVFVVLPQPESLFLFPNTLSPPNNYWSLESCSAATSGREANRGKTKAEARRMAPPPPALGTRNLKLEAAAYSFSKNSHAEHEM